MKKIIILDFTTGEAHVYPYDENVWEDCIEFIECDEVGLNSNNCQWMTTDNLNLIIH
jgi:hypothetical protein